MSGPVGVMEEARLLEQLVRVGAEVVTLSLNKISRQAFATIGVVEGQSRGESRNRYALNGSGSHDAAPSVLAVADGLPEEVVHEQTPQVRVAFKRRFNVG